MEFWGRGERAAEAVKQYWKQVRPFTDARLLPVRDHRKVLTVTFSLLQRRAQHQLGLLKAKSDRQAQVGLPRKISSCMTQLPKGC